jgi:hypothetical protein
MAAITARTVTEKRPNQAATPNAFNAVYTRTVIFTLVEGETAGAANLTGFIIPKDTLIMGGSVKFSADQGATATFKFGVATDGDFSTALAYNSIVRTGLKTPIPIVTTDNRQVVVTTAAAATTAGTCELTVVLCAVGSEAGRSPASGN